MSDTIKAGPAISETVSEVQGVFPTDAAMQGAAAQLTLAGFDHADFSLPATFGDSGNATPNDGAGDPLMDDDMRQARTLGTSMAGYAGAVAAAGATIATGGAAGLAIAAAAAVSAGTAIAANAAGTAVKDGKAADRDEAAAAGLLVLAVHTLDAGKRADAERIMRAAGATQVQAIERAGNAVSDGVSSTGWTG